MSRNVLAARRASVNASASLLEAARRWRPAVRDDWLSRVAGALPRHDTAHAALLADILDVVHGSSPAAKDRLLGRSARAENAAAGGRPHALARHHRVPVMPVHLPALGHGLTGPASSRYTIRINGQLGVTETPRR
jgi:hypothetical protein